MNIEEVFSSELYGGREFYNYFSREQILNLPFDLYKLVDAEEKSEDKFVFQNIIEFISDMYVGSNINEEDFKYIDSKFDEVDFCKKFSQYLYSDFLFKKEGAIFAFAMMKSTVRKQYKRFYQR